MVTTINKLNNLLPTKKLLYLIPVLGLFFMFFPKPVSGQDLFPDPGEVFRDDVVPRVDILIPQTSLNTMLAPGNEQSDYLWQATFIFDNGTIRDTLENVGFRLRGNTSRYAAKKSYKVSFNTYEPGRKFYGLEKMNLNGEHNDPTIMRSKVCWDLVRAMEIPGSRSNHVNLYVNGNYFGVYINVEHIDEEFVDLRYGTQSGNLYKCLWPADMNYLGNDPNAYKLESGGRRTYDLLTNTELDDYSDLANLIDVLNNTPAQDLRCALDPIFNVPSFLRAMAFDILSGNWDGPLFNKNNFYLYHDPVSGQFQYIPYDLDNTLGIDWFNIDWGNRYIYTWANEGEPRPLYWKILAVESYRELFSFYMKGFLEDQYSSAVLFPRIDALKSRINPFVPSDPYYPLDYGFSFDDFNDGFTSELPWYHTSYGLKPFITNRNYWADLQVDEDMHPIIFTATNNYPGFGENILVTARVADTNPVASVEVCYSVNGSGFNCLALLDDGQHNDGSAGDGIYGGNLPPINEMSLVEYYIKATDVTGWQSQYPLCGNKKIYMGYPSAPVYINEVMAANETTITDEAGEYEDWVELYFTGSEPLYLGDKYLSDNEENPTKWKFNNTWIYPGQFKIVWLDDDVNQGLFHANFKLSASGEFIGIFNNEDYGYSLIDGFSFDQQTPDVSYGRIPNGTGPLVFMEPTPGASNAPDATEDPRFPDPLVIYPNPFNKEFDFSINESEGMTARWQLTDASGKVLLEQNQWMASEKITVEASHLRNGVYILKVETADGRRHTAKVAKVK